MKKIDKSILPFIALGLFVIFETQNMNIGKFTDPGPGLFPLLLGIILLIFSFISLFITKAKTISESSDNAGLRGVFYVLGILLFFRFALPVLGYCLTTFLMLAFLLKTVGCQKWFSTIAWSVIVTGVSYLVFGKWLMILFPRGVFPF
jgi:putative tricarboxylic transport membrane protein